MKAKFKKSGDQNRIQDQICISNPIHFRMAVYHVKPHQFRLGSFELVLTFSSFEFLENFIDDAP